MIKTGWEKQEELNNMFPERHTIIHKGCCKHCPSNNMRKAGLTDPESKDLKEGLPKETLVKDYLFVCAWRPDKLCKGLCDYFEIDQNFINQTLNK